MKDFIFLVGWGDGLKSMKLFFFQNPSLLSRVDGVVFKSNTSLLLFAVNCTPKKLFKVWKR